MPELHRIVRLCAIAVAVLAAGFGLADAQDETAPTETTLGEAAPDDSPAVQKVGTIIFAKPEDGERPVPILGITLKEIARLTQIAEAERRPDETPKFHFAECSIQGTAQADQVSLELIYDIVAHEDRWVRVPLRLGSSVITAASFTGEGEHYLEYDGKAEAYFALIKSSDVNNKPNHQLKLNLRSNVSTVGNESRLELDLPHVVGTRGAPKMTLRVPLEEAMGVATSDGQARPVEAKHSGKDTELIIAQPGGEFVLTWRSTKVPMIKSKPVVFDASSETIVKWDSQSRIVWEATIALNVRQGQLTKATVELPPGARLLGQDNPGQLILSDDSEQIKPGERASVTIQLDRAISKGQSGEIKLSCERQLDPRETGSKTATEIAGFSVQGATSQPGVLGVIAAGVWHVDSHAMTKIIRLDELPAGFRDKGVLGSNAYRILSQPCSLQISVTPRQRHVTLAPTYIMRAHRGQVTLDARLKYRVVGRQLDVCTVILPGWVIQKIELLDDDATEPIEFDPPAESLLDIDLPRGMRGDFELKILASQPLIEDADFFVVNLPSVEVDHEVPPSVVMAANDNLEVRFDADRSHGISPSERAVPEDLPASLYPPQVFQVNEVATATFAAELVNRPRQVNVNAQATIAAARASMGLTQRLLYDVRHEALDSIELDVPTWWMDIKSLQFSIDDKPVSATALPEAATDSTVRLSLPLSRPRQGTIKVAVAYRLDVSPLPEGEATASPVSFAQPVQADTIAPFTLTIDADTNIQVAVEGEDFDAADGESTQLVANAIASTADLVLTYSKREVPRSVLIERAWLQSWLTGDQRQDRAVFRILTNRSSLSLKLPQPARSGQLMVIVDGYSIAASADDDGMLYLPMTRGDASPSSEVLRTHVVELGWTSPQPAGYWLRIDVEMPVVEGAWVQHVRWQVLTPRNHVMFAAPSGMAGNLARNLAWWPLKPRFAQRDFERWSGATAQPSPESIGQDSLFRQYSFSSIGSMNGQALTSVSASLAMLCIACIALALGAGMLYVRQLRHPAVMIALGLTVAGLAFRWPAAALFVGQTAVLILMVVVASRVLMALLARRGRLPAARSSTATTNPARTRSTTRLRTEIALPASPSTTANVGHSLPVAPAE